MLPLHVGQKGVWGFSAARPPARLPPSPPWKRAEKLLKSPRRLLPLGLHLGAAEGLLARGAELQPARLSSDITRAPRMSFVDFPLSQESRNGSWPGTEPGAVARSIHRIVGYLHSTESNSDDVCKLARELLRRTDDGSSLASPTCVLRSALGRLGGPLS